LLICIVYLQAITVPQDPKDLADENIFTAATTLAAGVDPRRSLLFVQSDVPSTRRCNDTELLRYSAN